VVEEAGDELASLGWVALGVPESPEVGEELDCAVEVGVCRWGEALELFLGGLAAHDVAGLGEVSEGVEPLQARELGV
jgi:hypothetical protein